MPDAHCKAGIADIVRCAFEGVWDRATAAVAATGTAVAGGAVWVADIDHATKAGALFVMALNALWIMSQLFFAWRREWPRKHP